MNRLFSLTILASLILIAAPACGTRNDADSVGVEPQFEAEGELRFLGENGHMIARIAIELAESSEEQAMGLMGRRSLPALGGMLFINDAPRMQHFWMKNTPLPLDIIFIRSDLTITNIVKRTRPLSADYIDSTEEAQYVLEVRAGFTDKYQIDETASIRWQRLPKSES